VALERCPKIDVKHGEFFLLRLRKQLLNGQRGSTYEPKSMKAVFDRRSTQAPGLEHERVVEPYDLTLQPCFPVAAPNTPAREEIKQIGSHEPN
jgi:hypothetical protein